MKKSMILSATILFVSLLTGCTSAYYASSGYAGDDLYVTHDKTDIARRQQQAAEQRKAEADARRAEWEARLAEAQAAAAESRYNSTVGGGSGAYSYTSVLADTYESAYARRLRGFESPTYRMPSSYWNFRYGDAFTYVSAYDPAFYNIVISGDQVWVEPKYITSMFGTWGATVYNPGWYGSWSWNYMPAWWGYSSWGWNWGFAWHPWHTPGYRPGGWRPGWGAGWGMAWGPAGGLGWGYRPSHNYRLDSYPRPGSSTSYRPSAPAGNRGGSAGIVNSGRRGSSYNSNRSGSYNNSGNRNNGSYNSGNSSSRSGSSNSGNSNNWNNNSGRGSYNSGSSRSSGGSGYSGGGYSGGGSSGSRSGGSSYNRGR